MKLKLYQMQVAVGFGLALLLAVLRHGASSGADTPLLATLEAASFGFCVIGVLLGGRSVRARYLELGSNRAIAGNDPMYRRKRLDLQFTAVVACSAVASLLASRSDANPFIGGLVALVAVAAAVAIANRVGGWSR